MTVKPKMTNQTGQPGFTLIELLVVISILGVLAGLVMVSFGGSQKQARDTQRKSDLKQIATGLETFAAKNNLYPSETAPSGVDAAAVLCPILSITCPSDPRQEDDSSFVYLYQSNGSGTGNENATQFVLWAQLENAPEYWVVCSNGLVGTAETVAVTGGTCPL